MSHPGPPPEYPPIVRTVSPESVNYRDADEAIGLHQTTENPLPRVGTSRRYQIASSIQSFPHTVRESTRKRQQRALTAKTFPMKVNTSASLLGPPMSLGIPYNQQQPLPQLLASRTTTRILFPAAKVSKGDRPDIDIRSRSPDAFRIPPAVAQVLSSGPGGAIELTADRQQFDDRRQVFTAEGNVVMRFRDAVLQADKLQVNLVNRLAVAEGNVSLTRGEQVLIGQRFQYNFVQGTGIVNTARGEIFVPTSGSDLSVTENDLGTTTIPRGLVSDSILVNQPPSNVTGSGGITIGGGSGGLSSPGGTIRRLRFEAEKIDFYPEGWEATNIRFTNDPFSPPELEVRADRATLTKLSPLQDEVRATRPRLVFDQRVSVPILRDRVLIDRTERDPAILNVGFDDRDRGGFFVERTFEPVSTNRLSLSLTPQFFLQRAVSEGKPVDPSTIGLLANLSATLSPTTTVRGIANFAGLNSLGDTGRGSLRVTQFIGDHTFTGEYSYRDRLFNGSLGFQTVQSSIGAVIASPVIAIGNTGINLNYQMGFQRVNAETDRLDLLDPFEFEGDVSLNRFQTSATVSRPFFLWKGQALPATATEGLKYTPTPVVPYLQAIAAITGTTSSYSNGENQSSLNGTVGLRGQFGHFSRPWFDYTGMTLLYTQFIRNGESPFKFDRIADRRILTAQLTQQIYGPFRVGIRTVLNLDDGEGISTDYTLEYSRRTYGISLRYNPELGIGSFNFRISDFNWTGGTEPFSGSGVRPVDGGVRR